MRFEEFHLDQNKRYLTHSYEVLFLDFLHEKIRFIQIFFTYLFLYLAFGE